VASIARNLGALRQGHNWRTPCPLGCGYTLSLAEGDDGKLLAYCHGGCTFDDILPALVEYGLLDDDDDVVCHDASPSVDRDALERTRIDAARWIYSCLLPAAGTIVAIYLRSRAITLEVPSILRFGNCPHRCGGIFPTMAAPIVDVDGSDQTATHMTYLRADGSGKTDLGDPELQRECRGVIRGGAIRLAAHDPERELIIAEGIETTLSAMQIFGLPGWSAVCARGLKTVQLPATVRRIVIAADNDASGAGQRNAVVAARRWQAEGRAVRIVMPTVVGDDFNDVLRKRGE
jgi:hypothetical protein